MEPQHSQTASWLLFISIWSVCKLTMIAQYTLIDSHTLPILYKAHVYMLSIFEFISNSHCLICEIHCHSDTQLAFWISLGKQGNCAALLFACQQSSNFIMAKNVQIKTVFKACYRKFRYIVNFSEDTFLVQLNATILAWWRSCETWWNMVLKVL